MKKWFPFFNITEDAAVSTLVRVSYALMPECPQFLPRIGLAGCG